MTGAKTTPLPHQRIGVKMMTEKFRGRALNADDLGLGKSCQSLWSARKLLSGRGNVVIVAEAGLKINWAREAMKHLGRKVVILEGRTPTKFPVPAPRDQIFVVNYDILGKPGRENATWLNWLRKLKPRCLIIDEIQAIKSRDALRTKACRELSRKVPYVFGLGGTGALEKYPADLFPILNILRPDKFNSFFSYAQEFCGPKKTHWGWEFKGATNLPKLHRLLKKYVLVRRRKEDVLKDLPEVTRVVVPVALPPKAVEEYRKAETDFVKWLNTRWFASGKKASLNASRLSQMTHLKKLAGELKEPFIAEWITNFHNDSKGKLLAFGWHVDLLTRLHKRFPGSVMLNGKVAERHRQPMKDRFNSDPRCVDFFGNMKAAGAGWSCTSSSTTLMFEFPWNPAMIKQAGGRNHGLGRGVPGEPNFEFWLVATGTIEEKILKVLQANQSMQDQVLDGKAEGEGASLNVYDQVCAFYRKGV